MPKTPVSPRTARSVQLETSLTAPFEVAGFNPQFNDDASKFTVDLPTPECHERFDQIVANLRNSGQAVDLKYDLKDEDVGMVATITCPKFPETGPTDQNSAKEFTKFTEAKVAPLGWEQALRLANKNEGLAYVLYNTVRNKLAGQSTNTAFKNACENENFDGADPRSIALRQQAAKALRTLGMAVTNWSDLKEATTEATDEATRLQGEIADIEAQLKLAKLPSEKADLKQILVKLQDELKKYTPAEGARSKEDDTMRVAINDNHLDGVELDPVETAAHFGAETAFHLASASPATVRRRALNGEMYDLIQQANGNYLVQKATGDKPAQTEADGGDRIEDYEGWRKAVKEAYPEVADQLKFKGRVESGTNSISAEVPGDDRSYGVYYPEEEYGVVFGTNESAQREGTGDPEEGWCVVSSDRPRIVIDGPYLDREDALKYKQSVSPAQSSSWLVLWGKEASDGSGEYVQTRAVNPTEAVNAFTGATAYKNRKGLTESFQINQDTRAPVYRKHLRTGNTSQLIGDSETSEKLEAGVYHVFKDYNGNTFFERKAIRSDELLRFEDGRRENVLDEIRQFWSLRENFEALGLGHKRGVLMFGPPGGGKSCIIKQVVEDAVNSDNVVIYPKSLDGLASIIREFRDVEPNRHILCVLEDVDGLIQYSEHAMLELFDGDDQVNHVLFLATTNYPERLPARVMRSGRFDTKIEIKQIPREGRIAYLQNKVGTRCKPEDIENYADLTEDFSFAQMREFVAATFALNQEPKAAVTRIRRNFTE